MQFQTKGWYLVREEGSVDVAAVFLSGTSYIPASQNRPGSCCRGEYGERLVALICVKSALPF